MDRKVSRRALVRGAMGAALTSAAAPLTSAQLQPAADLDRRLDEAERKLAKPLAPEVKKIAQQMMGWIDDQSTARQKQRLPENSEPCFTYAAAPYVKAGADRSWDEEQS